MSVTNTKGSKDNKSSPQHVESKRPVVNKYRKLDLEKELNISSSSDEEDSPVPSKKVRKRLRSSSCSSESSDSETICSPEIKVGSAVVYMLSKEDTKKDKTPKIIKKSMNHIFQTLN